MSKDNLDEVKASGEDSEVMDPIAKSNKRKLDKTKGDATADEVKDGVNKEGGDMIASKGKKMPARKADKNMSETIETIFDGEEFSEDFKDRTSAIFEAVIVERVNDIKAELEEENTALVEEAIEEAKSNIEEKINKYLDYIVTEWLDKNELAIESGIKSEVTESFLKGMKTLFSEHYVDIPEDKVDVVESLTDKVEELESTINEMIKDNLSLVEQVDKAKASDILEEVLESLTDTQKDRLTVLAEGIEYNSEEQYRKKLIAIKEGYLDLKKPSKTEETLNEEVELNETNTVTMSPEMSAYVNAVRSTLKK